ncbi:uncharacterized protein LOC110973646 isoform X1 [Acanthaster planci]|uniref:Uncharacterized protein LOC110973646 isoform X1 n=1 Tax=Acanthaster planci TaxID=133434 RepID=A0A8B7XK34_ACAPL|nr:uncharacterized protein LOC110973646 isoform X1 [Acanthaster planci]
MKAPSVCAILLWSCWCFGSPAEASLASINVGGDRNPQALLLAEASRFSRQLDEVGVREHRRFQRSLNGLPMHRVKRSDVTDFRHGFYPGTGVGNREEFEFSSLDRVMSASILNETIIEWGYIEIGINETLVMATTEEALLVFKLDLLKPVEKLSLIKNFSNVMVSEVFTRHSWQAGHIVKTTHYLTTYDSSYFLRHYTLETSNNITLKDSVDLGPISIVDLHYFAFDKVTYLAALTSNGFVRLYRWSSRYCKFSVAEDLTVSVAVSNVQAFDISGAHYLLVSAFGSNSTLFKYHSRQSSFRQYQLLYPDGAKQATYFTDAYEHYLVFINALGQTTTFFKWNGFKFEELQIINTAGANHWLPVPVPGSQDGTLLILSSNGWAPDVLPLTVYKHDPQTGIFQELSETPVSEMLNQPVENRIRLMGGSTYLEGRVEVYRNFTWGTVCDDEWDLQDANVVCRQLGYRAAVSAPGQARFCQGAGPIVYGNVNCLGNESMLHACSLSTSPSNCTHAKDAGVVCAPNGPAQSTYKKFQVENQIRLVGSSSYLEGRVEVYHNGTWGTICDDSWDLQDADVVCRQLGYGAAVSAPKEALFCHGSGPIVYSNVNCVGNESMLQSCDLLTSHNCVHDEDAGAVCTASHPTESVSCAECHNATSALSFHVGTDVYLLVGVSSYPYSKDPGNFFKMTLLYMDTDDPVVVESLQLEAKIDELDNKTNSLNASLAGADKIIANSVTKDGHEEIRGVKTFTEVDIKKAEVENINVDDAYIYAPRPTGNESLGYVVNKSLAQRKEIEDFLDFLNNVVTLNTTQTITGVKNITSVTIQGALNTTVFSTRVFDGVNIDELNREAFRLNVPNQVINGELTFSENLTSTESIGLDSGHLVNDVDLSEDVVLITSPQTITGMKTIQQNMSIENDMVLHTGVLLNDIDPSDQLVTLSGSHVITGQLNFTDVIHIDGDIVTDGTIDGVTVNSLCGDVMTKSTNQTVSGPIIFLQPPVFDTDVVYGGLLRQVNMTRLADEAVRINQGTKIAGAKTFMDDVSVTGNVIVDGLVTNIDLQQDVVQLAVAGNLTGARVFGGLVEMAGVVNITGTVNGLDLSQDVVTLKGDHAIQGKKTFVDGISAAKNISVTGTVDTVDLSTWASNVMTLSTNQTVQGPLVFTNDTNMRASLNVTGLINGIDLQAMYRDTFFKTSDQVQIISGNKTFMKPLTVTTGHIAIEGLINGLNMTEDYLNKFSDQNVTRQKTFVDGFSADGGLNVSGLIAGN